MNIPEQFEEKVGGLNLHMVPTTKYKTNTIVLKMKAPLTQDNVTQRALLPYVLQSGTEKLSSTMQIRTFLDECYGATLHVDLSKKGEYQIITFAIDIANEKFLSDQTPLLEKAISLLGDVLLSPVKENGVFKIDIVEKEKRSLSQRIQAVNDDKMRYANLRLIQEMCKDEPYHLHVNGELEDVEGITAESLYKYYKSAVENDEIDLYVVGDIQTNEVTSLVKQFFQITDRPKLARGLENVDVEVKEVKKVFDEEDVKQGKLNIGYRTYTTYQDKDYYALQVFNGVFGGFSHSKLFINVREKASLAYYAASRYESHKGLLLIMSGIEFENYEQAVKIITEQMQAMKQGEFSEEELEQTKAVILNQLLETLDTSRGLIEILYQEVVANFSRPFTDWFEGIKGVSKEEVISVSEKLKLDTVYFLKGKEVAEA